jgi:hypothetical protein
LKDSYSLAAPVSISNSSNSNSHISGKRMTWREWQLLLCIFHVLCGVLY